MPPKKRTQNQENHGQPAPIPIPIPTSRAEEAFRKHHPPTFNGLGDPIDAEKWIRSLDRIFDYMSCTNEEKLTCAQFQLIDDADYWWESVKRTMTYEQWQEFTWEDFKEEVYQKYIPDCYREKKESEF